tara:strand:- start:19 stop:177 length:159 start_codon:yes stop_codon:yes gene_type:complete
MSIHYLVHANMMVLDRDFDILDLEIDQFYELDHSNDEISSMISEILRDFDKM